MAGYTKLFHSILTSTIWQEDAETKVIWVTLLALADANGMVDATVPGLAHLAHVSVEKAEKAISKFLAPDQYSRTQTDDGRRIMPIDGGWLLLNHASYRRKRDPEERREQNREAQQRFRAKKEDSKPIVSQCKPRSAQAEAEAEAEAEKTLKNYSVGYDYKTGKLTGLTEADEAKWAKAFPAVDITREVFSAALWLGDNPTKRKKDVRRFLTNWLRRKQERGGSGNTNNGTAPKYQRDLINTTSSIGEVFEV